MVNVLTQGVSNFSNGFIITSMEGEIWKVDPNIDNRGNAILQVEIRVLTVKKEPS